jgi:hypothetical protein
MIVEKIIEKPVEKVVQSEKLEEAVTNLEMKIKLVGI